MNKENIYNIPNLLSFYRLITFPILLYLIFMGYEKLFVILYCINLSTDVWDGIIARYFNLETKFGARLDSLADIGSFILAFVAIFKFKLAIIGHHIWLLYLFIGFYILVEVVSFLRFKKYHSLHLYSKKIGGYLQGIFLFTMFAFKFFDWLYYIALLWGILTFIEEIIVILYLKDMKSNAKGLYWLLFK
ncbi:MAG: CDP-alcohol phosphatidyltransferase family protein [Bacteroidetes bacterium]|mgnify:FL=1|nr:CDP-alcohol phosphatidyltransferase family protein [Bacteroidota bacterium]MBT5992497.1 CDP-alcohol phosphatidyltransferase family protein [Bacteroidota bacterium]MBT7825258.1 CDP-alcohol phosphatidyltransferase family protein [Bacteroidota bacterium]MBT7994071.1 CDP-alcohol phosphatidyltransferase family protein [Bacteroidota bacterium]